MIERSFHQPLPIHATSLPVPFPLYATPYIGGALVQVSHEAVLCPDGPEVKNEQVLSRLKLYAGLEGLLLPDELPKPGVKATFKYLSTQADCGFAFHLLDQWNRAGMDFSSSLDRLHFLYTAGLPDIRICRYEKLENSTHLADFLEGLPPGGIAICRAPGPYVPPIYLTNPS